MTKQVVNNGDTGLVARSKINSNFTELYDAVAALEAGGGGGGGGTWGSITGTLSSQADLAAALATKAPLAAPQITGAWTLSSSRGQSGVGPITTDGFPGAGFFNFFGAFAGGFSAGNDGAFYLELPSGRVALDTVGSFKRYVATDDNGGAAFSPLFVLDSTNSSEGGFYCPKTGPTATVQYWASARTDRLSLKRDGTLEFLTGTTPVFNPASSVTPANNGNLVIQATSNTSLTFKLKGSDGTVRSGSITLS